MNKKYSIVCLEERLIDELKRLAKLAEVEPSDYLEMLLEKNKPMKLVNYCFDEDIPNYDWDCPRCNGFHRNDSKLEYCSYCGQKIDWSE